MAAQGTSAMTPGFWRQVKEILGQAQEVDPQNLESFLDAVCREDDALRQEVVSLLDFDAFTVGILDDGPLLAASGRNPAGGSPWRPWEERRIGPYRVERVLAEGGMGTVLMAVREDDFSKRVALKLIKSEELSEELLSRFHMEQQILANLNHPNIAAIHDGGTEDGVPYFAMEYIEGESIDNYCQARELSIRERLDLFRQVCSAVQVAHQNLIVHRDIKPGNILISAEGVPKLIDFGIAKPLSAEFAAEGLATAQGSHPMTPRYASPEQFGNGSITTASDIYSLGVVLFELLTGEYPYLLESSSIFELGQVVCEVEPQRPSSAVWHSSESLLPYGATVRQNAKSRNHYKEAKDRAGTLRRLHRRLAGDLDSIVLKALHKDPTHRYSSAEQFSEDIRRHLAGVPVSAREGTMGYRTERYIRRNWRELVMAAAVLLALSIAAGQIAQAGLARRLAEARVGVAESQIEMRSQLLTNLFTAADLEGGGSFTVRDLLDRGQERIRNNLEGESLATQLETLGLLCRDLELRKEWRALLEETLRLRQELYRGDHPLLARILNNLAAWHYRSGDLGRAEELYVEALDMRKRLGQEGVYLVRGMSNLASILMGRGEYGKAEDLYRKALAIAIENYGDQDTLVAGILRSLGILLYYKGNFQRAELPLREALEIRREAFGARSTKVANVRSSLGRVLHAQGRLKPAGELFMTVLEVRQSRFGEDHFHVALAKKDLAALRLDQGDSDGAELLLTEALRVLRESRPEGSWEIADAESLMGACLTVKGRYEEAQQLLYRSYVLLRKARGEHAIHTRNALGRLQDLSSAWGKPLAAVMAPSR